MTPEEYKIGYDAGYVDGRLNVDGFASTLQKIRG